MPELLLMQRWPTINNVRRVYDAEVAQDRPTQGEKQAKQSAALILYTNTKASEFPDCVPRRLAPVSSQLRYCHNRRHDEILKTNGCNLLVRPSTYTENTVKPPPA